MSSSTPVSLHANFVKRFTDGPTVRVDDLRVGGSSFHVTVLFGASGAGKTTILRCLAGLERPQEGFIRFGDESWLETAQGVFMPPRKRNVGFVPQDYALFPHLSVEQNIAFGLRGLPASEKRSRLADAMRWLALNGLEARLPQELSGGQQQRVALARAVVRQPRLLLLDEPLSALDTPTRQRLRGELRSLLAQLGLPTILVTHDRLEAAALGDQIVVMDNGQVLQSGSVADVFNRPGSLATARIVGTDTVLTCEVVNVSDGLATLSVGTSKLTALAEELPTGTRQVHVCIRAEDVILTRDTDSHASPRNQLRVTVRSLAHEGPLVRIELDCGFPLKALLTRQACAELELKEGCPVTAMIKAPQIHLISHSVAERQT